MKKILIIALLIVGCDYAPTEHTHDEFTHTHEHEHDTTHEHETEDTLIDREFVVIEVRNSVSQLDISSNSTSAPCPTENPTDCAGECGGSAVEQTYYYDYDSDGLGNSDYSHIFCSANVQEGWVLNSDDDDDTIAICYVLYTINILEEDLEISNGEISFTYNEEDYLIDVSSCLETEGWKTIKIVQNTELKIFYAFDDADVEMLHYSSPNELLYVK